MYDVGEHEQPTQADLDAYEEFCRNQSKWMAAGLCLFCGAPNPNSVGFCAKCESELNSEMNDAI